MSRPLNIVSLFSGVGGLDYGFEAAGFQTRVALEWDAHCCRSLRASRNWPVIQQDIAETSTDLLLSTGNLRASDVDVLIGGPPCQPFSKSAWWASGDSQRLRDPRAATLNEYLRVLREIKPRAFLMENVEGLGFGGKDDGLRLLLSAIERINRTTGSKYRPTVFTVNAADFGVPQTRTRLFIVGAKDGQLFRPPSSTHSEFGKECGLAPWLTAWDAIGHLSEPHDEDLALTGKWADLLPTIPEGLNYLWHTDRMGGVPLFGWRRRYWNFLLKLAKNRPAWTIQAQPGPATGPFHWRNRRLSTHELARLQTFPTDIEIVGSRVEIQRQIGNAVPSLLAEIMAREMAKQFFGVSATSKRPTLLPAKRKTMPPPEPLGRVPAKYMQLAGAYSPHPGTGKGFLYAHQSAVQRDLLDEAIL